ncbi:hypothetical protein G7Y79_00061g093130 [Physcia stellaris]|nr:hypothetical protein G7Y79_00061g093130 [Physcia stellaris]
MTGETTISTLYDELMTLSPSDREAFLQRCCTDVNAVHEQEKPDLHKRLNDLELALKASEAQSKKLKEDNEDLTLKAQKQESLLRAYEKEFKNLWKKNEKLREENEDLEAAIEDSARNRNAVYDVEEMGRGAGRSLW